MTILKTFEFYGYYVTTLRYHNTGKKVPIHTRKWEYIFTVSERINNKSKTILTLDIPADKLSQAKRALRSTMVARKLLEKKGNTYVIKKYIRKTKVKSKLKKVDRPILINKKPVGIIMPTKNIFKNKIEMKQLGINNLNKKIRIQKNLIINKWTITQINHINREFQKSPKRVKDYVSYVRIFNKVKDDLDVRRDTNTKAMWMVFKGSIIIGLENQSLTDLKIAFIHELGHSFHYGRLSNNERHHINDMYKKNKYWFRDFDFSRIWLNQDDLRSWSNMLQDSGEFFAEIYSHAYLKDYNWFDPLSPDTLPMINLIIKKG